LESLDLNKENETMSPETASTIQAISGILSAVAAATAIFVAVQVEQRAHRRFEQQLQLEITSATAHVKPLISVYPSKFIDRKAITLTNAGLGTAVITGVTFSKGTVVEREALYKLFTFSHNVVWDYYWLFTESTYYVQAGQKIVLVDLKENGLTEDGHAKAEVFEILNSLQQQMEGVKIEIAYSDVLGNKQPNYKITLRA
jgi:hypothetical protein